MSSSITQQGIFMPFESNKSCGYAFIEYLEKSSVKKAIDKLNGKDGLGKRYIFMTALNIKN